MMSPEGISTLALRAGPDSRQPLTDSPALQSSSRFSVKRAASAGATWPTFRASACFGAAAGLPAPPRASGQRQCVRKYVYFLY